MKTQRQTLRQKCFKTEQLFERYINAVYNKGSDPLKILVSSKLILRRAVDCPDFVIGGNSPTRYNSE